ncbi:hypothetical protein LCGC14_0983280 [marine sediment metagenome]|uniref:Uncharacterized protein n=1 Tax=marine sediment metagenome TaxID=412755 RepID=A0A0F9NCI4_9ZZZZ
MSETKPPTGEYEEQFGELVMALNLAPEQALGLIPLLNLVQERVGGIVMAHATREMLEHMRPMVGIVRRAETLRESEQVRGDELVGKYMCSECDGPMDGVLCPECHGQGEVVRECPRCGQERTKGAGD